jgi:hypothetical protein
MIVQVCNHSPFAGSFHPSHNPANTNGESSFILIEYGILPPGTFFHSKKPSAGTRHRRFISACRHEGAVSMVSALALMVLYAIATGSALTILARRENPPNGGCEQFRLGTENDRDQA